MDSQVLNSLAIVDLCIGLVVVVSMIIGIFRGLVREALSLLAWGAAFWVAYRYSGSVTAWVDTVLNNPALSSAVSSIGVFIGTLLGLGLVGRLLTGLFKRAGLNGTDRALGAVFGMVRGVAITLVVVMVARLTLVADQPWYNASVAIPYLNPIVDKLALGIGGSFMEEFESTVTKAQETVTVTPSD